MPDHKPKTLEEGPIVSVINRDYHRGETIPRLGRRRAHGDRPFGELSRPRLSSIVPPQQGGHGHERSKGLCHTRGRREAFRVATPGRSFALKLLGRETDERIVVFEEILPAGTTRLYHLHRDSDEVAWALAGEFIFKIGDEVAVGGPGTCAFMPRKTSRMPGRIPAVKPPRPVSLHPAIAGGLIEALSEPVRSTMTNASNSTSATTGKSSAQTRSELLYCSAAGGQRCCGGVTRRRRGSGFRRRRARRRPLWRRACLRRSAGSACPTA